MLKKVGFFRELRHGEREGPSLEAARGTGQALPEAVRYLEAGSVLATTGMRVGDALEPERTDVAELAIHTDGTWVWPADLPYYVERYGVPLPAGLLEHMERMGWRPPELSQEELEALEEQLPAIA